MPEPDPPRPGDPTPGFTPGAPRLVVLSGLPGPSGGTVYNTRLAREWAVTPVELTGSWPRPTAADLARLHAALLAGPEEVPVLVDGMLACAAPEVVAQVVAAGRALWVLVHLPLPAEGGLAPTERDRLASAEAAALQAATGVVTTSAWAATDLHRRYGVGAVVAEPGTDQAPAATGSTPPCLLTVASFTPRKNHQVLVDALARLTDLDWTAHWVGAVSDHDTTADLHRELAATGLSQRVHLRGPLLGEELEAAWARADLLLLPSWAETYAMVVAEALVRGLPALVSAGTAAQHTLTGGGRPSLTSGRRRGPTGEARHTEAAGAALDPSSPQEWSGTVRSWLCDPVLRDSWRARATRRGGELPSWSDTAAGLLNELRASERIHAPAQERAHTRASDRPTDHAAPVTAEDR